MARHASRILHSGTLVYGILFFIASFPSFSLSLRNRPLLKGFTASVGFVAPGILTPASSRLLRERHYADRQSSLRTPHQDGKLLRSIFTELSVASSGDGILPTRDTSVFTGVPLTTENVESVLEEIRPYLKSHGGSVRLVETNPANRQVILELQGACSGCPSASVTLRDGIERTLREVWPDIEVKESITPTDPDCENTQVDDKIIKHKLQALIDAVERMGGQISVANSKDGLVNVAYRGPNSKTVKYGLEMELADKLGEKRHLVTVTVEESES